LLENIDSVLVAEQVEDTLEGLVDVVAMVAPVLLHLLALLLDLLPRFEDILGLVFHFRGVLGRD